MGLLEGKRTKPQGPELERLPYKSGIPTLRSSAHRVKSNPKTRKHDPNPKDANGRETKTTWLPQALRVEKVFSYDVQKYNLREALVDVLKQCDETVVGKFRETAEKPTLENFIVEVGSTWRSVNGGSCEDSQRYLSERVNHNEAFLSRFDSLVQEVVLPELKKRLAETDVLTFYYQRPPTLRLQPGPAWSQVKAHDDAQYGHQNGELNFWIPLTDRGLTKVDLHCESEKGIGDYHPIAAALGEIISFHGSSCKHFVNPNESEFTRVSIDFRVGVQGFFDQHWQMRGTTDDHMYRECTF